jgi:hypothetical protein
MDDPSRDSECPAGSGHWFAVEPVYGEPLPGLKTIITHISELLIRQEGAVYLLEHSAIDGRQL